MSQGEKYKQISGVVHTILFLSNNTYIVTYIHYKHTQMESLQKHSEN